MKIRQKSVEFSHADIQSDVTEANSPFFLELREKT